MPTNILNRAIINFIISYSLFKSPLKPNSIEYNFILVLINRFIKLVHYYLVCKTINIIQLTKFLFRIFAQIEPLNNIISNRGSVFINKY